MANIVRLEQKSTKKINIDSLSMEGKWERTSYKNWENIKKDNNEELRDRVYNHRKIRIFISEDNEVVIFREVKA